jgi:hypothetical protein
MVVSESTMGPARFVPKRTADRPTKPEGGVLYVLAVMLFFVPLLPRGRAVCTSGCFGQPGKDVPPELLQTHVSLARLFTDNVACKLIWTNLL